MEFLNPLDHQAPVEVPTTPPGAPGARGGAFWLLIAASALFVAGIIVVLFNGPLSAGLALRWAGIAMAVPFVWRRRSLLAWTLLAMVAGTELGVDWPQAAKQTQFLADIFLRLIRMIVAPLIFGGIVTGIAGHSKLGGVGRVAIKAIVYFEVMTTIGIVLGMVAINLTKAGVGVVLPAAQSAVPATAHENTWQQILVNLFPENIAQAVAQNQILQVAVFALIFGAALATLSEPKRAPLVAVLQSLTDAMFRMTSFIVLAAPVAAGAALAFTVSSMGIATMLPLVKLLVTCYAALLFFLVAVFVPILMWAGIPVWRFAAAAAEPAAIGFATTSSEAALPLAIERMREFGVPSWIVSFVIPMGYSFDLTGSSLYLSMAAVFASQAAGIHMTLSDQIVMIVTLMIASKGVAGVPRATLVVLLGTASMFHIPVSAVLLLLGVDTLMDMGRTSMNVIGNCMAAAVVARWEGEFEPGKSAQPVAE